MIDIEFEFRYEGEKTPALSGVAGHIDKGKCVVLCGSSGCGKSTLLRCVNHLVPQFYDGKFDGFCRLNGQDTKEFSIGEAGEIAASVFQDPRSQFFTMNSSTELAFGLENFGVSHDKMIDRVEEAFKHFHLGRLKNRAVFELSSGERQLVAIMSAGALNTEILLLDEPTANLDFMAIEQLGEALKNLKEQGKTMLISEHRLYYLIGYANTRGLTISYIVMQLLACVGSTIYPYAITLNATISGLENEGNLDSVIERAGKMIQSWGCAVLVLVVALAAFIGAMIGKLVVKKHLLTEETV